MTHSYMEEEKRKKIRGSWSKKMLVLYVIVLKEGK